MEKDLKKIPKGYKQSEIGVIPEDWSVFACSDTCVKIQDGTHFSPKAGGNEYLYITSKNIRFGYMDISTADRIDAAQHWSIYKRCNVQRGDLLLTKDGANTGNAALNDLDEEFSLLSSVAFLRFDPKKHVAGYFLQQILSSFGQEQIKEAMSGNAITRLTLAKINQLRFAAPSCKEQSVISATLLDADVLIERLEKTIEKKKLIKQGAMQELLTGKRRLPGFSGRWEEKKLGEIAEVVGGGTPSSRVSRYWNGEINWFTPTEVGHNKYIYQSKRKITEEGLQNSSAKILSKGTVLLTSRAGIGDLAILMIEGCTNQGFQSLVPKDGFDCEFIYYVMLTKKNDLLHKASGSTFLEISPNNVKSISVLVPLKKEQSAIVSVLSDMDTEIEKLETQLLKYQNLKQGMMQVLLTGKIRLIST